MFVHFPQYGGMSVSLHSIQMTRAGCHKGLGTIRLSRTTTIYSQIKHGDLERSFVCSQCGSKFLTASDLKAHEDRHARTGRAVLHRGRFPASAGTVRSALAGGGRGP